MRAGRSKITLFQVHYMVLFRIGIIIIPQEEHHE